MDLNGLTTERFSWTSFCILFYLILRSSSANAKCYNIKANETIVC